MEWAKQLVVLYVSNMSEHDEQWVDTYIETARAIGKHRPVVYWRIGDQSFVKQNPLFNRRKLSSVVRFISGRVRFLEWNNLMLFPTRSLESLRLFHCVINAFLMRLLLGKDRTLVIISSYPNHMLYPVLGILNPQFIAGDRNDVWDKPAFARFDKYARFYFSNSPVLHLGQKKNEKHTVYDYNEGHVLPETIERLHGTKKRKTQVTTVLFIGTLTWRVDYRLLHLLMEKLPHIRMLAIGTDMMGTGMKWELNKPDMQSVEYYRKIRTLPNYRFIPIRNQRDLIHLDVQADVGIIPYKTDDKFTKYSHPLKLYHYFALGIPVVSVPIPSILKYASPYCAFAETSSEFVRRTQLLSQVVITGRERERMYRIARKNTYMYKAAAIIKALDSEFKRHDTRI